MSSELRQKSLLLCLGQMAQPGQNSSAREESEYSKIITEIVLFENSEQERERGMTGKVSLVYLSQGQILLSVLTQLDFHLIPILFIQLILRPFMCQALER